MVDKLEMTPGGTIRGEIRPPGSKSITNRALVCAALADGQSVLTGALESEDTHVMLEALRQLGVGIECKSGTATVRVTGCGGRLPVSHADLFVANSGTTMRFLTALATLGHGTFRMDGTPRMRQRPIEDLVDGLQQLGANVTSENQNGCPPVLVRASGLPGGRAEIAGSISSQFLSGLLMVAPLAERPVELVVVGELVSKPYIETTLAVMEAFGVTVQTEGLRRFVVPVGKPYRGRTYAIEPDASAASYFLAAAAITGGEVTVLGLSRHSLQGDVAFCDCLARMGCRVQHHADAMTVTGGPLHGIEADMNAISDTVQTLAAVALFAEGPTTIYDAAHIRHKETDRIGALAAELRKLGAEVEERFDGLRITPRPLHGAKIATYNDHRMAMSLSLVGLRVPGVIICDPGCTAKTYPGFFEDLARLRDLKSEI